MTIGFYILGSYCFFASILGAAFAKLHFSIHIPLFIGEIVMSLCLGISGVYLSQKKIQLTKLQRLFVVYLGFIVLWAGYECFKVGGSPLALRNAVLFFYPVFAFFTYSFYSPAFFSNMRVQVLLAVLLLLSCIVSVVEFFYFIYFILFLAVLYALVGRSWKYTLLAIVFFIWPFSSSFSGARTWLVASLLTGLILIFIFVKCFLTFKKSGKLLAGAVIGAFFLLVAFHFADKSGIKTLITPMKVLKGYNDVKILIKQKEPSFHSQNLITQLYNSERDQHLSYSNYLHAPKFLGQSPIGVAPEPREEDIAYNDIYFRFLIWDDMMRELWEKKSIFGVGLSHPQRSRNIEILNWAGGEWSRDGWITPHNSYLHLIYRAGIIGIAVIVTIFMILGELLRDFIRERSVIGLLLSGTIIYGLIAANFLLILELPYYAIPFWSIFGLTMAYRRNLLEIKK